ncbi:MAG: translocation/assembly module TamB domain-containing protein, partial [Gammaproteobacteria bacterium]|nr:translocation/assembly module TamB domain-containing protein [Gammaproteobacteria bacterium]
LNPALKWPELTGRLGGRVAADGRLGADGWAVAVQELAVQGNYRGAAIEAEAKAFADGTGLLRLDKIELRSGNNRLSVQGERRATWELWGTANLPEIQTLVPGVSGTVRGEFRIDGAMERPDVTLDVRAGDLTIGSTSIGEAHLAGTLRAFGHTDSKLAVNASALHVEGFVMDILSVQVSGTRDDHTLELQANGQPVGVSATLQGVLAESIDWQGTLRTARMQIPGGDWELVEPLAFGFSRATQRVQLPAHCWRQTDATLCLSEPATVGAAGDVALGLAGFDVARLGALLPAGTALGGRLHVDGQLRWAPDEAPRIKLAGALQEGEVMRSLGKNKDSVRYTFRELVVQAELDTQQLAADISLDAQAMGSFTARISVRPIQAPWPLHGQVNLRGLNIAALGAFFPQLTTLSGVIDAEGSLGGDLKQPVFNGQVNARNVAVAARELPLALQDGRIDVDVRGTRASFAAQAQVAEGGDLQVTGDAQWSATTWELVLRVQGRDVTIRQKPLLEVRASPRLELRVEPRRIQVAGDVQVPWARVTVQEIPVGVTRVSRDVVIVDAEPQTEAGDWQIETHVRVVLGTDVRFSGLGLRAKLSGDVQFDQVESKPVSATGEIVIDEGEYSAYGQKLKITEGRLLFVDSLQPDVSLTAVREVGEVTAGLQLRGTLERPQTTLFAEPPQTETNTLSYIVLGRPMDTDNREDGRVLTQAALALGLAGGGRGLATQVAEQFGIQDFEIETQDDPTSGPQVVLRGRLSPNLTVRYGVGVLTPENVLTLRYDLTKKLYVEVAQGIQNALDFFYSVSF